MRFLDRIGRWRMDWQRLWRRRRIRAVFWFLIAATFAGVSVWSARSGLLQFAWAEAQTRVLAASGDIGLIARRVEIEGRSRTSQEDVLDALAVEGQPALLTLDLKAMRERLAALPWVGAAVVERRYPDTLVVRLEELQPFALWQHQGRFYLIAEDGRVIVAADRRQYHQLPIVVGAGAPERARAILGILGSIPELGKRVAAAVLVGERRWNVRLDNGIDVKLPEDAPEAAWRRLAVLAVRDGLLEKDISIIDLRFEDRVVVRLLHPAPADAEGEGEGKET